MPATALVVDDDHEICTLVRSTLEDRLLNVVEAHRGQDALRLLSTQPVDVVILDISLPDIDGFELCHVIRQRSRCPVLMLTGRAQEADVLRGFAVGANDYVTKPFQGNILQARVMNLVRTWRANVATPAEGQDGILTFDALVLDLESRSAWIAEREVHFTRIEFDILTLLMTRPNRAFTRAEIIADVWRDHEFDDDHVLETHISRLRKKIDSNGGPRVITSLRGVGYRLRVGSVPLSLSQVSSDL